MYIPKQYQGESREAAITFMKQFNFATIVTTVQGIPMATHLPFTIKDKANNDLIISSHFAKANQQWKHLTEQENLVIFQEPHAYISPTHYNKKENVPTWNYLAVHAYGKAQLIEDQETVFSLLEEMMNSFEPAYKKQWDELPMTYKTKMIKGIVAFEMTVTQLNSKEKLSQNKKENERQSIINSFEQSNDMNEQLIAKYMREKED